MLLFFSLETFSQKFNSSTEKQIYQQLLAKNKNNPTFILHSGPPYANDAHGLPTELKALQVYKNQAAINLRQFCHNFALEQVQIQKEQLKKLGLFTNYEEHYITLDKKYEAEQIRVFGEMVKKGLIYQGFRPIHWSCSHETALAGAEIEYYEKKDTSLYFKIKLAGKKLAKVERKFLGKELVGKYYFHPYRKDNKGYLVSGDEFIQEEEGTGIVHLAPAFGAEDFMVVKKEKIIIECPMESNGIFNQKIGVSELIGVPIPVLYKNNEAILNSEIIDYVAEIVAIHGSDRTDIMDVWLDSGVSHCQEEYKTEEKRGKVKELDISKKNLEGTLDLSDFINLEKLNCAFNQLSVINLSNCLRLKDLDCGFNKLTSLDLNGLNQLKRICCNDNYLTSIDYYLLNFNLTYLNVSNNNLSEQDLSIFSELTNLEFLRIGGSNEKYFSQNVYNKFYGTLETLKNLTKLKHLDISNTDINNGKLSSQQLKEWIEVGFYPTDYEFMFYLKQKGYHPQLTLNYEKLKEAYNKGQGELDLEDFKCLRVIYISCHIDGTRLEIKNKNENNKGKTRSEVTRLSISEKGLEGELDLSDFVNLTVLNCQGNKLTNLNISKNFNLTRLRCYNNGLTNLDTSNNKKLIELQCCNNQLKELNVINNTELTTLICYDNKLTNLSYIGCEKLKILNCHNNYLTNLDYSSLPTEQLFHLDIRNNNLFEQDLSVFSRVINLKRLYIGNNDEAKIQQDIYNRFVGSLKSLVKLTKLERLDINNTNVDDGLEYLPNTVQELRCSIEERPDSKVKRIKEQLRPCNGYFLT
ncbi:13093_t:CDS:10 [Funneliformis geosporum]|uniref:13093_t:CDS:1 n=1 Tax=Funneliformis geosporum TaxID=1117311 RepID=A0A9W4WKW0_9GLOM|nr:13093_t:CDS:10 [Funneliformis geosporum]